ncbi:lasso peptide biosynthesis PqqD family chaperone [Nonomuraea sp. NPDC050790]|uniref:lasso peptide biosynthesis PqqD family chaperone n=1 Tax=Nonomuraea sp. NPDC050790 TaxID=3364371 RepID=UPI0037BC7162
MYALAPDISAVDTEYGIALLHEVRGQYWSLNPTGAVVLRSALESGDPGHAVDRLVAAFDVDGGEAAQDVASLMNSLLSMGILVRRPA